MTDPSPDRLRRITLSLWATIGGLILLGVLIWVAVQIRIIWLPLAFAGGLVLLLDPIVSGLERRRIHRAIGTTVAFLLVAAIVVALVSIVVPVVERQSSDFAQQLPDLYDKTIVWVETTAARVGLDLGGQLSSESIRKWIQDPANQAQLQEILSGFGSGAGRLVRGVAELVAVAALAPILAFYLLLDVSRLKERAKELTPPSIREEAIYVAGQAGRALGGFVRGQLLVAFIVGVASSVGLFLIDMPFWLIIGIIAGVLNLIPFIGPIVGGALAAGVALLTGNLGQALWAVGIFTAIQQTDNHVITPLVQRTRVKLPPVAIVLALIVGGSLAGLLGVLVAVPLTGVTKILVGHSWRTRVLGQSWTEATESMIEVTPRPDGLVVIRRKAAGQQGRLFDTAEQPVPVKTEVDAEVVAGQGE